MSHPLSPPAGPHSLHFKMLNPKVQSSREAGYWCRRQARGGTQTALGESAARHTHSLCVQVRGLGSADDERVQTALFPHGIHIRRVSGISVAFRSILSRVSAELGGQPGGPWESRREPALSAGPLLSPHLMKLQRLDCFTPAPLPSPALLCSPVCGGSF